MSLTPAMDPVTLHHWCYCLEWGEMIGTLISRNSKYDGVAFAGNILQQQQQQQDWYIGGYLLMHSEGNMGHCPGRVHVCGK